MQELSSDCFTIFNINGQQMLYCTQDTSINKLTFSIINATNAPLPLIGNQAGNPSVFTFDFESLLTDEVVKNLILTLPENWDSKFIEATEFESASWSVYPNQDITLDINNSVSIIITNISCTETNPGNFWIDYKNVPGYTPPFMPIQKHLAVLNPPDSNKKTLPLKDSYTNVVHPIQGQFVLEDSDLEDNLRVASEVVPIYITYDQSAIIENGFTYLLTNTSKDPLVSSSTENDTLKAPRAPTLYISFLFGTNDHDLTTQLIADSNIEIDVSASLPWMPVKHMGGSSYWQFLPTSKEIMKAYETVRFPIHKLITPLNVPPEKITIMYIQFNDVPGYNDGAYTLIMEKQIAVAEMKKLEADRYTIFMTENINISWESSLAKRVTIEYFLKDGRRVWLDSNQGDIKLNEKNFWLPEPPTAEHTTITAIAYDNNGQNTKQIFLKVTELPQAQIVYFSAGEMMLSELTASGDVSIGLSWNVKYAKKTTINYTWNNNGPIDVPLTKTSLDVPVNTKLHSWCNFTLSVLSINEKYPSPVTKTVELRNLNGSWVIIDPDLAS